MSSTKIVTAFDPIVVVNGVEFRKKEAALLVENSADSESEYWKVVREALDPGADLSVDKFSLIEKLEEAYGEDWFTFSKHAELLLDILPTFIGGTLTNRLLSEVLTAVFEKEM